MTASTQTLLAAALEKKANCLVGLPLQPASSRKANILPFTDTLHYPGCGCPPSWTPGARVCDRVDALGSRSHQLFLAKRISANRPLRVCYMLPHHNITGGMKCLVEHIRLLRQRGHYTIAVHRSDSAKRAMPPWTAVEADVDVVCNLHQRLSDVYPVQDIDVVVVGIFHQVAELLAGVAAPVLYWEQGHEWVFGDPVRLQTAQNYQKQDQLFHIVMHLPCVLAGVSSAVLDILQQEFGRSALLIPNGIDCDRFTPGPWQPVAAAAAGSSGEAALPPAAGAAETAAHKDCHEQQQQQQQDDLMQLDGMAAVAAAVAAVLDSDDPLDAAHTATQAVHHNSSSSSNTAAAAADCSKQQREVAAVKGAPGEQQQQQQQPVKKRILIVGNPALPLKGFPTAIAALAAVAAMLPIQVRWVCQVAPTAAAVPNLPLVDFDLETVVSPGQAALPDLYRGHDVFLFTSRYEAWGMPVLEAMASGVPVVTTDCLGVRTFCSHGDNCLIAAPDDAAGVAQHLLSILTDKDLSARLAKAGRDTALQYTPDKVMDHLESVLYCLTACGQELLQLRQTCIQQLQQACTKASEACSRPPQQQQLQALQQQLKQHILQHQQQLALLHQQRQQQQQQQASLQNVQLHSLRVLQQLNLAGPVRQQQQQLDVPLQASLLMPFLQVQQQQQPGLLQLQLRSSAGLNHHSLNSAAAAAAVVGDVMNLLAASQQQQQEHQQLPTSMLQPQQLPALLLQQQQQSLEQQVLQLQASRQLHQQQQPSTSYYQQVQHQLPLLPTSSLQQQQQLYVPTSLFQLQQNSSQQAQQQQQQQQLSLSTLHSSQQHLVAQRVSQQQLQSPLAFAHQQQQQQQLGLPHSQQQSQLPLTYSQQQQQQLVFPHSQQLLPQLDVPQQLGGQHSSLQQQLMTSQHAEGAYQQLQLQLN